ncbi:MAG: hypothetical protein ACFCU4_11290 [Puniceicoccaceae bacterium]
MCSGAVTVESNWWPGSVRWVSTDTGEVKETTSLGPFYRWVDRESSSSEAIRPLAVQYRYPDDGLAKGSTHLLHPLFSYYENEQAANWNIFRIVRGGSAFSEEEASWERRFEIFPVYFDHRSADPEKSYWGLLPIYGEVKNRFFMDRIEWVLFPLYTKFETKGETSIGTPWPFIRRREGNGARGGAFWPFYGYFENPGIYEQEFFVWPLGYDFKRWNEAGELSRRRGFLPFYAIEETPTKVSRHHPWPFIGYTQSTSPRYAEERFLWPFFVQGEGENLYRNRWAPFYSHSVVNGREHEWWLWPLLNRRSWYFDNLRYDLNRVLYVVLWHMEVSDPRNPDRPKLEKTHLWPFFSYSTDNHSRKQFQFPSLLEVWTQPNEKPRDLYNSFFSLYQYEKEGASSRHSLLWNLITFDRQEERSQFTLGPLFDWRAGEGEHRTRLLKGFFGYEKTEMGRTYSLLWWQFGERHSG